MATAMRPSLRVIDFVVDLHLAEDSGDRTDLFRGMARFTEMLPRMKVRFHTKKWRRRRPCQWAPWLGFDIDAQEMSVRITKEKCPERKKLRE